MGYMTNALVDTGASRSIINEDFWNLFSRKCYHLRPTPVQLEAANGEILTTKGVVTLVVDKIGQHEFIIVPSLKSDVLLGSDFLEKFQVEINYVQRVVKTHKKCFPMKMADCRDRFPHITKVCEVVDIPEEFADLLQHPTFREQLGHCTVGEPLRINTSDSFPIKQKPYRQPLVKRKIVEEEIEKMLQSRVIQPSQSPWASPVTLVPKPDGSTRFCVDYRKINAVTEKDCYPIPNIQELFDTLQGATIFSTLDLKSGYWQVDLHPDDVPKTAFVSHCGLYEFLRLPFGLVNAPGQFQRLMNRVLSKHLGKTCLVYIDDIVCFSKNEEEHRQHLIEILDTLADAGLTLKLKKCKFAQKRVELLGYTISKDGISPQEDKVSAIRDMAPPEDVKGVQRFLGMSGYYRQTIPNYADVAEPLTRLTRKNELFRWGEEQNEAFEKLKAELTSDRVMAFPDPHLPYKLYTDASAYAVGAILAQDIDGIERPIHYVSKALTTGQKKWSAIEREAYAVIYSITKLRPYLQGAKFTVYTDHKPLKSLFLCELKNSRVQRWAMVISEMGCTIEHRKGINNTRADMLSRIHPKAEIASLQELISQNQVGTEQQHEFSNEWEEAETGESENYVIDNGELYSLRLPYEGALPMMRLMAPKSMRTHVMEEAHKELGHRGSFGTLRRLQNFVVWPRMTTDVKDFLKTCPHCQGNRRNPQATVPQITDIPSKPFERVGVDLTGPFLPSPTGNKYLLVVVDHLTGWAEVYPIPDKRSQTVWMKLYSEFFSRFGFPNVLITDQGQEFNSEFFRTNLKTLGISHKRTTPGHPQTNGVAERFNRTLKETLRKLVNNQTSQWESYLPEALWAYRVSETESRGSSPYYLLFGQIPNKPNSDFQTESRFENLARAQRLAYEKQEQAKQSRHDKSKLTPLGKRIVNVGDCVTINCPEPVTMSHLRDHSFKVVSMRGKVVGCVPLNVTKPGRVRYVNIDRVRVVPGNISWNDINPRSKRNRTQLDVRTWTHLPPPPTGLAPEPDVLDPESDTESQDPPEASEGHEVQAEPEHENIPVPDNSNLTEPESGPRRSARLLAKRTRDPSLGEEHPPTLRQRIETLRQKLGNLNI